MMLLPIYRSAVRQFDSRVRAVRPEQWTISTPDDDWDVHRLVRHVILGQSAVPNIIDGVVPTPSVAQTPSAAVAGADRTAPELVDDWASASVAAVTALTQVEYRDQLVHLPDGTTSVEEMGWRLATDLTVHAWDLARAVDAPDEFPNDLLGHVLEHAKQSADSWFPPNRYAPAIPVPGCTDDLTELLALTGRNRWWRRSARNASA
ncbi:MAG: TIGR03086 family metal-binding protein [Nakamurella sp.]